MKNSNKWPTLPSELVDTCLLYVTLSPGKRNEYPQRNDEEVLRCWPRLVRAVRDLVLGWERITGAGRTRRKAKISVRHITKSSFFFLFSFLIALFLCFTANQNGGEKLYTSWIFIRLHSKTKTGSFPVALFIILYNVVQTFEFMHEIPKFYNSSSTFLWFLLFKVVLTLSLWLDSLKDKSLRETFHLRPIEQYFTFWTWKKYHDQRKTCYIPIFLANSFPPSTDASLLLAAPAEPVRPLALPSDTKSAFSISKCLKRRMKNLPHSGVWWGSIRCNIRQVWINRRRSLGTASYWCSIHL